MIVRGCESFGDVKWVSVFCVHGEGREAEGRREEVGGKFRFGGGGSGREGRGGVCVWCWNEWVLVVTVEFVGRCWCFEGLLCVWLVEMATEWERHGRKDGENICALDFLSIYVALNKC